MLTCCLRKKIRAADTAQSEEDPYEKVPAKTIDDDQSLNQETPKNQIPQIKTQRSTSSTSFSRSISLTSFYSVNSSRSVGDGDYYSVCSVESFKSV